MTGIWLQRTGWGVCLVAIQHKQVREAFIQGYSRPTVNNILHTIIHAYYGEIIHHHQTTKYVYSYLGHMLFTIWF